ncbi:hypothetical protein PENPOL_c006G02170 [Penicillium polonicum]|uniref:Uncharacterized protein n=1 Tax=Penicillium polonicum TaxID=60169 RepID=A0A1V6NJT8_PENPO|nr:hypothetical protein PENPOL_c006G02170 [Penicillium polonicum]
MNQLSIPTQPPSHFPAFTPEELSSRREYYPSIADSIKSRPFWGLPIFRLSYGDDGLWNAYIQTLYGGARESLRQANQEYLFPYFFCPVFSDPSLQGSSHDTIREKFTQWVVDSRDPRGTPVRSDTGFGSGAQESACLVVDDDCLKKFNELQHDEENRETAPIVVLTRKWDVEMYRGWHRAEYTDGVTHKLIAEEHNAESEDPEDRYYPKDEDYILFDEVDGLRVPVLGWMWAEIGSIASLYQHLSQHGDERESWYKAYARPPRVFPDEEDGHWKL